MSEKMGTVALESDGGRPLFGNGLEGREYSERISAEIDAEVRRIIDEAYAKAQQIINTHRKCLDAIAKRLIEKETIERDEFEQLLILHGIEPKHKQEIIEEPMKVNF